MEDGGSHDSDDWNNDIFEGLSPEEYYDMKVRFQPMNQRSMKKTFSSILGGGHSKCHKSCPYISVESKTNPRCSKVIRGERSKCCRRELFPCKCLVNLSDIVDVGCWKHSGNNFPMISGATLTINLIIQVFMVRSLFETDSKVNTIWKKLSL